MLRFDDGNKKTKVNQNKLVFPTLNIFTPIARNKGPSSPAKKC